MTKVDLVVVDPARPIPQPGPPAGSGNSKPKYRHLQPVRAGIKILERIKGLDLRDGRQISEVLNDLEGVAQRWRRTCTTCGGFFYAGSPRRPVTCGRRACISARARRTRALGGRP